MEMASTIFGQLAIWRIYSKNFIQACWKGTFTLGMASGGFTIYIEGQPKPPPV